MADEKLLRDSELPEDIRQFLLHSIDSVAELEALLLMHAESESTWNAVALARRLYVDEGTAEKVIHALHNRAFVRKVRGGVRYDPGVVRRAQVQSLAAAYPRFLLAITDVIHSKARSAAQRFADPYRIRQETGQ
jgi:hypothetical protein